jgi:manganese/iron transport system permease protein
MLDFWQWLSAPFAYQFMQNALLASLLIAATCGIIGSYVVLRRLAFIGDALAHTALPGVVIAYMNGWSLVGGALAAGIMTALGIGWMARKSTLREDTAIGVIFTAMFAFGDFVDESLTVVPRFKSYFVWQYFGRAITRIMVDDRCGRVVLVVLVLFHKELELTSFDSTHAEVIGIQSNRLRTMLLLLLAFTVVTGIQVVGVVLTSALLVTPAAAASLVTSDLRRMMAVSADWGWVSVCGTIAVVLFCGIDRGGDCTDLYCRLWCNCID